MLAIPDGDFDSCSGELACEKPKFEGSIFSTIIFFWRFQIEISIVALGRWPVRGPCFKATVFQLSIFSWGFQIEISIVGLGSWPVRGPSFKVVFSNFLGDSRLKF